MAYDYPQTGNNVASAATTLSRKPGAIMTATERIEKATGFIFDQGRMLQGLGDRVCGTRPTAVSSDKPGAPPACELGRLEAAAHMLEMAASFLQDEVQRLEQL